MVQSDSVQSGEDVLSSIGGYLPGGNSGQTYHSYGRLPETIQELASILGLYSSGKLVSPHCRSLIMEQSGMFAMRVALIVMLTRADDHAFFDGTVI